MIESGFVNGDCMDYLKEYPDNYFDLAICDPPYGDGGGSFASGTRFGERFDRYKYDADKSGGVARETEIPPRHDIIRSDSERRTGITRTGGTWATKYAKKL